MHEEKLPESERMLGVQLWLNLPAKDKMCPPAYQSVKNDEIKELDINEGKLRILAGSFAGVNGFKSKYLPLEYYDIHLNPNASIKIETKADMSLMLFTLTGEAYVGGELVAEKTAVKLTPGDFVEIKAGETSAQVLFVGSAFLGESVSWGGPIVMNTKEELTKAFEELRAGTFLKTKISY